MAEYLRLHHRLLFLAKVVVIQFLCTIHRTPWYNTTVACGARCLLFASVLSGDDPSSRHADRVILRDSGFSIQTAILDCGRSCTDALYYSRNVFFFLFHVSRYVKLATKHNTSIFPKALRCCSTT